MSFDPNAFRESMPEFRDIVLYPDTIIIAWGNFATGMVNPNRWKSQTALGINLYTAHEITLQAKDAQTAANGGTPGGASGPLNSKTVGSVTASFDTQQASEKDAGWWNLTTYGKQFYRLAMIFGSGALQV